MRLGLEAGLAGQAAQDQERAGAGERAALALRKSSGRWRRSRKRPAAAQVPAKRVGGASAERDDPLLAALADRTNEPLVEVDAALLEADRLAHSQARAVEQLDERPVAQVAGLVPAAASTSRSASPGESVRGKRARATRQRDVCGRVVLRGADQDADAGRTMRIAAIRRAMVVAGEALGAQLGEVALEVLGRAQSTASDRASRRARSGRGGTPRRSAARSRAAETARNASTSGSRVRSVIHLAEPSSVHVAVRLRGRQRAVAEQLLDHAQVCAALEQVRGERVAQPVRVGEEPPDRARVRRLPRAERKSASSAPRASSGRDPSR